MEYRILGGSGLKVPALSFGTASFGGGNEFFRAFGTALTLDQISRLEAASAAPVPHPYFVHPSPFAERSALPTKL